MTDMKLYLVIETSFCPDYEKGNDWTTVSIGFTLAESIEAAREKYPSKPYGSRFVVLGPDEFHTLPEFRG